MKDREVNFRHSQVLREPLYSRGDLNIRRFQPIHESSWIWFDVGSGTEDAARSFRFRKTFHSDGSDLILDISADERFVLFLDGVIIGRGPDRAAGIENWLYHSYEVSGLDVGEHLLEVVAWRHGEGAPKEQLSYRGGLIVKAGGTYAVDLDTVPNDAGEVAWEVGELFGTVLGNDNGRCWGAGASVVSTGQGLVYEMPKEWRKAVVVRGKSGYLEGDNGCGLRIGGWMLYPTSLKNQIEREIRPGEFVSAIDKFSTGSDCYFPKASVHPFISKMNELLHNGNTVTIGANTEVSLCWDLKDYYSGYPYVETVGGRGAVIEWGWAEGLYDENNTKGCRDLFDGKAFTDGGFRDRFIPDGGDGRFSTQWWRCGRWCELRIKTGDEELVFSDIHIDESRYPLERESDFSCSDESLKSIEKICTRVVQQCAHETLFDGPFYEQQMYPGDTRIQLLTLGVLSKDDRMIRRAIEIFDFGQRDNGMMPMNWPTRLLQESATYTQCWVLMVSDYVKYHNDISWLRVRLPSLRKAMAAFELYEDETGLISNLPGWSFMDWVSFWDNGSAPSTKQGDAPSSLVNLFYILDLEGAAYVERALGHEGMARCYEEKIPKLKNAILENFFDDKRGWIADTTSKDCFSEHAQCLALLANIFDDDTGAKALETIISENDPKIARCTVYFSYYLFEAIFKVKMGTLFLKKMDLWHGYVRQGLSTTMEMPEDGGQVSRSDCHAWGSHPLYWMHRGLCGIKSGSPFFESVIIEPNPGALSFIKVKSPHPNGDIVVDLRFRDGKAIGIVLLPKGVKGTFIWNGNETLLSDFETQICQ